MTQLDGKALVSDVAVGSVAGYGATMAMEHVSSLMYQHLESEEARRREEELRKAMPTVVMVGRVNERLGQRLRAQRVEKLGTWLHFGFGTACGPVYALLRRRTGANPVALGLGIGASVSLVFDETLTPAAGLSPPNRAFPWQTHARAFAAHLVFGLALAALVEGCWRAIPAARRRRSRRLLPFADR